LGDQPGMPFKSRKRKNRKMKEGLRPYLQVKWWGSYRTPPTNGTAITKIPLGGGGTWQEKLADNKKKKNNKRINCEEWVKQTVPSLRRKMNIVEIYAFL
jgi:hypothetical protein